MASGGLWYTTETPISSRRRRAFGAVFTKAVRLQLLGDQYKAAADRAWIATQSRIDSEGGFYGVSALTHVPTLPGDDAALYKSLPTEVNVWGQGSALRFAAERFRSGLT